MEEEYQRQKARGGIIDREIEDSRFLVVTENITQETPSAELNVIQADQDLQQNQQQSTLVQATANSKVPIVTKPEWSRAQPRSARGNKWNRRSETSSKERPISNAPRPSNPPNRQFQAEKTASQPRLRAEGPFHPSGATRTNGTAPLPTQLRPPPGFEPR